MTDLGVIAAGVLIGSATGIGGAILGAWMNGRSQMASLKLTITAEAERAKIAEKRRIYAGCLAAYSKMAWPLIDHRSAHKSDDLEWKKQADARIKADEDNLGSIISELRLIAPASVAELAENLQDFVSDFVSASLDRTDAADEGASSYSRLYKAMRVDLGEPPLAVPSPAVGAEGHSAGPEAAPSQ